MLGLVHLVVVCCCIGFLPLSLNKLSFFFRRSPKSRACMDGFAIRGLSPIWGPLAGTDPGSPTPEIGAATRPAHWLKITDPAFFRHSPITTLMSTVGMFPTQQQFAAT